MLLTEANSPDLEARRGTIERLAADLKKAGIKFRQSSGTSLDIFNKVTVAQPIYTAVANKNGAFDLIDKSVQRTKLSRLGELDTPLFGNYNDRNRLVSLTQTASSTTKPTAYYNNANGDTSLRYSYNSGTIDVMKSDLIRKSKSGEIMYGHEKWVSEIQDTMLVAVDVIRNGQLVTYKSPSKRELKANPNAINEWREIRQNYYGSRLGADELYNAALAYIVDTIDSTTVNAAIKGGKDKYVIKPAKELIEDLETVFDCIIDSNIDSVENVNAENPTIQFTPVDDITIKIIVNRPGLGARGVVYAIYNTDKTILYANAKENMTKINTPGYETLIRRVAAYSEKNGEGKRVFDTNTYSVVKTVIDYLTSVKTEIVKARAEKERLQSFTNKVNAKAAADAAQKERDIAKQNARLDRKVDAQVANKQGIEDVANDLWGSDEEYDKFIDSLL